MLDVLMFVIGVLGGGASMYYIQPQVKLSVAKAFGWEQDLYDQARAFVAKAGAAAAAAKAKT